MFRLLPKNIVFWLLLGISININVVFFFYKQHDGIDTRIPEQRECKCPECKECKESKCPECKECVECKECKCPECSDDSFHDVIAQWLSTPLKYASCSCANKTITRFYDKKIDEGWGYLSEFYGPEEFPSPFGDDIVKKLDKILDTPTVLREAGEFIQKHIYHIQHPKNCSEARFLYCSIANNCGAGCIIHQLTYCFYVAFATQRTFLLGTYWQYLRDCTGGAGQWKCVFQDVSSCPVPTNIDIVDIPIWTPDEERLGTQWTHVPLYVRADMEPPIRWATTDGDHYDVPMWTPPLLYHKLIKHHYMPKKWLVGQLASYLIRLNNKTKQILQIYNAQTEQVFANKTGPIIGMHVRRTDKIIGLHAEAKLRKLEEYMAKVETYYKETFNQDYRSQNPIIYLATDDPSVYEQALKDYPFCKWLIFKNELGEISGERLDHSSVMAAYSILSDLKYLSMSDYLVGTFSSQVSRLANELSETYHMDGKRHYTSLDHVWYFP